MLELDDIVNAAPVYLLAKDKHANYIYCNEKYAEFLDLDSPSQIVGKSDKNYFAKDIAKVCLAGDSRVLNGGILLNYQEVIEFNRKKIIILTSKTQLTSGKSCPGIVASFVEINDVTPVNKTLLQYDAMKKIYPFKINNQSEYFTQREYEIFEQLFLGLSAKQIAARLSLSSRTVEDYLQRIKRKLQCAHKNSIIETSFKYGILKLGCAIPGAIIPKALP